MIEQLPPELAKLIAAERAAPVADHAIRAVVKAKLAASIASAPAVTAAGATTTALGIGKVIATVALVVGAGTAAVVKTRHHATSAPPVRRNVAEVVAAAPTPHSAEVVPDPAPKTSAVEQATTSVPAKSVSRVVEPVVPSQAEMLQQAWNALSHGDANAALELATRDASAHAEGALAEERDALRILSLAKLGRDDEAVAANVKFSTKYPNSIHRHAIERALTGGSP